MYPHAMHVLVTGGAGFIGRALCARLHALGHRVTALDDLSQGRADRMASGVRFIRGDVRDALVVADALEGVDAVVHLAAVLGPARVAAAPVETWSANVMGSATLLEACAARGLRVLLASTSEVYGHGAGEAPLAEDREVTLDPRGRREVYAISKLAAEAYALALHRSRLVPVTVVRPFNVVGRGQSARYGMVLARFIEAARSGTPLPVYGDGSQRRCFLHVDDAVDALVALLPCVESEGLVVNLGNDSPTSILALAHAVQRVAQVDVGVQHIPFERVHGEGFVDPPCRVPDLTRLRSLTGWTPTRTLEDAIRGALASPSEV